MSQEDAVREFKEGLTQLSNQYVSKALVHFSNAARADAKNPY